MSLSLRVDFEGRYGSYASPEKENKTPGDRDALAAAPGEPHVVLIFMKALKGYLYPRVIFVAENATVNTTKYF